MAGKSTGLPANIPPELRRALEVMKESIDQGEGNRGDPLLRNLKVIDLIDLGYAKFIGRGIGRNGLEPTTPPPNRSTPPRPTNFVVDAGVFHIALSWSPPYEIYGNHAYAEIWRNTVDNRSTAVMIATDPGFYWADQDVSYGTTYYYWVRFVSTDDVTGPYNAANGTPGAVSQSPQELLDRLNGQITETELYQALNDRIDLIDGPPTLVGSVAQRVQDEANARIADVDAEEAARQAAVSLAYTELEQYADSESAAAIELTQLVAAFGGNAANALSYTVAEVDTDLAVTTQFNSLDSRVTDAESDITSKANITYVDQAVADEENARTTQFNQISAEVDSLAGLKNGDFETGDSAGWSGGAVQNVGTDAHRGTYVMVVSNGTGGPNSLSDSKPIGPGEKIVVQAWAKPSLSSAPDGNQTLAVRFFDASGAQLSRSVAGTTDFNNPGWEFLRGALTAPAGSASLRIDLGESTASGQWWWDDVGYAQIPKDTDIGEVPATIAASVTEVNEAIATATGASASSISQLSTQHGDNTSTIQVHASSIDGLEGQYSVKIDVNGQVAGYGLSNTANEYDGTVHSVMLFSVDTFAIGSPGATDLSFVVDNGQVVMDAAYIVNLVVDDADISSLSVGKINGLDSSFIITTIENLAIVTQKLANNAATASASAFSQGVQTNHNSSFLLHELVSVTVDTTDAEQVYIHIGAIFANASGSSTITLRLRRSDDGTVIQTWEDQQIAGTIQDFFNGQVSLGVTDNAPLSGTTTYRMEILFGDTGYTEIDSSHRFIFVIGRKK